MMMGRDAVIAVVKQSGSAIMRSGRALPIMMYLDASDGECSVENATACVVFTGAYALYAELGGPETIH